MGWVGGEASELGTSWTSDGLVYNNDFGNKDVVNSTKSNISLYNINMMLT